MKHIDWNNVEEIKDNRLTAGGYVCGITAVEDRSNDEYLLVEFDIAEGEFKNYYRALYDRKGFWAGKFVKSYKEKAWGFFKKFLTAVETSNSGYKFNDDEKTLKRKLLGIVLASEEYIAKDGTIKERLYAADFLPVDDIRAGRFDVPALKKLNPVERALLQPDTEDADDDNGDLPF